MVAVGGLGALASAQGGPGGPGDCNGNGIPDDKDIAAGTSSDCDLDGVPDECQFCLDPDGNTIPDPCERDLPPGVIGQYYLSIDGSGKFSERLFVRHDETIDFDFENLDDPDLPNDDFSVRWTGVVIPPVTGPVTFFTTTDDGVRLWVGGDLVIDKWQPQSPTTWSATVECDAGVPLLLRMEYYQAGGGAIARLEWEAPKLPRQIVPNEAFQALADADGDGWSDAAPDCDLDGIVDAEMLVQGATDCDGDCVPDACEVVPAVPQAYWRFEQGGGVVVDAGPFGLDGVASGTAPSADVPIEIVPQTGSVNTLAVEFFNGAIVVEDADGRLSFPDGAFTIEAWVRLDAGFGGGFPARQMLVQKKPLDAGDGQLEFAAYLNTGGLADAIDEIYGRTEDFTGRELALRFGNGGSGSGGSWAAISNLELGSNTWQFVSYAFDPFAGTIRFGIDGAFETIAVGPRPRLVGDGPVVIGAHTNASGGFNQFLDGRLDELRITGAALDVKRLLDDPRGLDCNGNGIPDVCDILQGVEGDCDGDGTPDACDPDCDADGVSDVCEIESGAEGDCDGDGVLDSCEIAAGAADCDGNGVPDACQLAGEDCNANGIPDACDIADGLLGDCDGNGIPDACELGEPLVYRIDDGGAEFGVRSAGTHMVWLTNYRVEQGAGLIESLEMSFVFLPDNANVTVGVWSDPDGDGDPTDAQLLTSIATPAAPLGVLRVIDIPDTYVGPNGTSFFIGAYRSVTGSDFPAPIDASGEEILDRCWVIGHEAPIDLNNLAEGAVEFSLVEDALPFSGKWLSRCLATTTTFDCNENGVLDQCEIADGTVEDSDGSGVPDECEDCNQNGVLDSSDIAAGDSVDCNGDLVPDECQIGGNDCDGDGVLDECQIAQDPALDCNGNGRLDACDLAAGSSEDLDGTGIPDECEDCNANGVLDSFDIADGTSLDCNADLVPDECQLGEAPLDVEYALDDGTREGNYGVLGSSELVWLNHFETEAGGETIGTVGVIFGSVVGGTPCEVGIWSDPDGDGDPTDAQLLATAPTVVANGNTNVFNLIPIQPTPIGPAGTSFFVGVLYFDEYGNQAPIAVDNDSEPMQESWVAIDADVDPNDLSSAAIFGSFINDNVLVRAYGFDGALPSDCNENGVPDECDIADGLEGDANGNGIPDSCEGCVLDLDGDGVVGPGDLAIVLASWSVGGGCDPCGGDVNGDGVVDAGDLAAVLAAWGPCNP
jgi:hypothetical protein